MGQCYNSIIVKAGVDDVWAALRGFHDLSFAPDVITSVEAIGDIEATEPGARRKLNGAFLETLLELNDQDRVQRYSIDDGPGPVAADAVESYEGIVNVYPVTATGETFVLWRSEYKTKDDSAVHEFCDPIYQALLKSLAAHFETSG